jgi:hypothetical protein
MHVVVIRGRSPPPSLLSDAPRLPKGIVTCSFDCTAQQTGTLQTPLM